MSDTSNMCCFQQGNFPEQQKLVVWQSETSGANSCSDPKSSISSKEKTTPCTFSLCTTNYGTENSAAFLSWTQKHEAYVSIKINQP